MGDIGRIDRVEHACLVRLFRRVRREVGVAGGSGRGPHRNRSVGGERPVVRETRDEVGVGDVRPTERDQVGLTGSDGGLGGLLRVAAVAHQRAAKHAAEIGQRQRRTELVEAERQTVHHVQVGEPAGVELRGGVEELFVEIGRAHVVVHAIGREPDADAPGPDAECRLDDFSQEAETVFHRAAVGVGALICFRLEELVDQIFKVKSDNENGVSSCLVMVSERSVLRGTQGIS